MNEAVNAFKDRQYAFCPTYGRRQSFAVLLCQTKKYDWRKKSVPFSYFSLIVVSQS